MQLTGPTVLAVVLAKIAPGQQINWDLNWPTILVIRVHAVYHARVVRRLTIKKLVLRPRWVLCVRSTGSKRVSWRMFRPDNDSDCELVADLIIAEVSTMG